MNQEQLMKFTIMQMERERKLSLENNKKKYLSQFIGFFYKKLVQGKKSRMMIKGGIDND